MLLEVQAVRMARLVLQQAEVELRHQLAAAVADLPVADADAVLLHPRRDAEGLQQVERRRVERTRAQVARQPVLGLEHDDGYALLAERERAHEPGRAGTGDDDG
jgi:hypothetical protein